MKGIFFLMLLLVSSSRVDAQNITGNDLLAACESEELAQAGFCVGYIVGVIEGTRWGIAVPMFE